MAERTHDPGVTRLAGLASAGDQAAARDLLPVVYEQLRAIARQRMSLERARGAGHTLQATAVVHEAYARLVRGRDAAGQGGEGVADPASPVEGRAEGWPSRRAFYLAAAREIERVLVDHARAKLAKKRGGDPAAADAGAEGAWRRVPLDVIDLAGREDAEAVASAVALREAISRLEEEDAHLAAVVRLRFFAGLTAGQAASALGVSERTVVRDWAYARAWLAAELTGAGGLLEGEVDRDGRSA